MNILIMALKALLCLAKLTIRGKNVETLTAQDGHIKLANINNVLNNKYIWENIQC